jgi:acetylglutamate kinase
VIEWIRSLTKTHYTVICVGGGSQINEEFRRRGIKIDFGPLGRKTKTLEERQLARDILELNQRDVQNLLAENGIMAVVMIPVVDIATVLCHVNGDIYVKMAYLGFHDLYVLTFESRKAAKEKVFEGLHRVRVVGFPDKLI